MLLSLLILALVSVALHGLGLCVLYRLALTLGSHVTRYDAEKRSASERLAAAAAGIEGLASKMRETRESLIEHMTRQSVEAVTAAAPVEATTEPPPPDPRPRRRRIHGGLAALHERQLERRAQQMAAEATRGD